MRTTRGDWLFRVYRESGLTATDVRSDRVHPAATAMCPGPCRHRIGPFTLLDGYLLVTCTNRVSGPQRSCSQASLVVALPASRQVRVLGLSDEEARTLRGDRRPSLARWLTLLGVT